MRRSMGTCRLWPEVEGSQEGGGQSTEGYGGITAPKA